MLIWEGVLGNIVGGARILSIAHYGLAVASSVAPGHALRPGVGLVTACVLGAIIIAVTLAVAVRQLGRSRSVARPPEHRPAEPPTRDPPNATAATPSGVAAVDPVVRYSVSSSDGSAWPAPTAARSPPSISP